MLTQCETAPRVRGTTGLYHFAVLVPSRADLARSLRRIMDAESRTARICAPAQGAERGNGAPRATEPGCGAEPHRVLQGAADHGVSEALYLADVDGNGIEIYRDRPREEWPFVDGRLQMGAAAIDFEELLAADDGSGDARVARGTKMGHVHLHVSRLDDARRFYVDVLGFELMQRYGPSALFVSAGGYNHHIGLNTWAGVGAPPPPPGAIGLKYFVVRLPNQDARRAVLDRVRAAGIDVESHDAGSLVRDPSGNAVLLAAAY